MATRFISAILKGTVAAGLCMGALAPSMASAAACQPGDPNCVLPIDPPSAPAGTVSEPPPVPLEDPVGGGLGWLLPLLALLAALGGVFALLDDGGPRPTSP